MRGHRRRRRQGRAAEKGQARIGALTLTVAAAAGGAEAVEEDELEASL